MRENGRIILPVVLNDSVSTNLVLDNGTTNLALDNTFSLKNNKHLMLSSDSKVFVYISMPDGEIMGKLGKGNLKIKSGSSTIESTNFIYLYNMSGFYKDKVSGFFPINWLSKNHLIYIDPRNSYITLPDTIDYKYYVKIPFTIDKSGAFCIQSAFKFNCKGIWYNLNGIFLIDFGNPRDEIWINKEKIIGFNLKVDEGFEITEKNKKPFQIQNVYADTARIVSFGDSYFKHLRISIEQEKSSPYEQFIGVIGEKILENYIVVIDYKNQVLYLKSIRQESVLNESNLYKNWGLNIRPFPISDFTDTTKCKWIVAYVKKNKKADTSGIELWDELQSINGISIDKFTLSAGINALDNARKLTFRGNYGKLKLLE